MTEYRRLAVYWAPAPGALADATAAWLGWDPARGEPRAHPAIPGLPAPAEVLTAEPRRYGFHATLKAPFRPAEGRGMPDVARALEDLAARLAPVRLEGLAFSTLSGFVALRPEGEEAALSRLAARLVEDLDPFRAPLTEAEIARRHPDRLDPRRRANLLCWGYPHVMEEFRFHMTLSGRLEPAAAERLIAALTPHLAPLLPRPFPIDRLCLFGERADGMFEIAESWRLTG